MGKRRSGDRGASLVELALALPLLVMLLVGMVSAGIAYNHQLALTHAAREGGRNAATLPVDNFASLDAWLQAVSDQTIADATGTLQDGVDGRYVCVAYVYPHAFTLDPEDRDPDDQTKRLEIFEDGSTNSDGQQCIVGGDGRPAKERRVQVVVARGMDFNVVFFSWDVTLDAEAVNRYEAHQ